MRPLTIQLNEFAAFDFFPFQPLNAEQRIPLVLVLPGGGYLYLSTREAKPVALRLNTNALHAVVLRYTTASQRDLKRDDLLAEVRAALAWLETQAETYQIDTTKISVMGFSAGGNLAAHCANEMADKFNKAILVYPATSFAAVPEDMLEAGFQRLFARVANPELDEDRIRQTMFRLFADDPTLGITGETCPVFVFQTGEDTTVDPLATLQYCLSLQNNYVPFELFFCQKGPHGLSLADETCNSQTFPHQAAWFDLAVEWLKDRDAVL